MPTRQMKAVNYFSKKLHLMCDRVLKMPLLITKCCCKKVVTSYENRRSPLESCCSIWLFYRGRVTEQLVVVEVEIIE